MEDEWYYQAEYGKLKDEQIARIGFRDNMVYATLTAVGAVWAFAMTDAAHCNAFLVLPWVTFILGWLYVVNDQKISAIGRYVRYDLTNHLAKGGDHEKQFGWEVSHRSDPRRRERKVIQTIVDMLIFVASGCASITAFFCCAQSWSGGVIVIAIFEGVLMTLLGWQILAYADFKRGK